MRELLLIAKAFALEEGAKKLEMDHVIRAVPYVEIQGGDSVLWPQLREKEGEGRHGQAEEAQRLIGIAEKAPQLPLEKSVTSLVRKLTASKASVYLKGQRLLLPSALALASDIGKRLGAGLKGQTAVVEGITAYLAGLGGQGGQGAGLKGVFLFAGPPASGKSLAARLLAEGLGPDYRLWEFDCSGVDSALERFAFDGSRSAFMGSRPGELTSFVRSNPKTVIVLDHFDRMNPAVQTFLLPLLETGVLKDGFGFYEDDDKHKSQIAPPEVDFSHCYLVINVEVGGDLYDSPLLLDRLRREGGEPRVNAALLESLRKARNELLQPLGPCFAAPVLSRLVSKGMLALFRRLEWPALHAVCREELASAAAAFRQRHGEAVEVRIQEPDEVAALLVLAEGGQVDARQVGRENLMNRLFGPVLAHWLEAGAMQAQVVVELGEGAGDAMVKLRETLGPDPTRSLFRTLRRVAFDPALTSEGEVLRVRLTHPRLEKIVSGEDYQGPGALLVESPDTGFADIAGMENIKASLLIQADLLRDPGRLKAAGLRPPGGALFHGSPGTGKTSLARAFAGEAGLPFIAVTAPQLMDPASLRQLFDKLRRYAPSVLFIDELDALGVRGEGASPIVNQLLAELDGFNSRVGEGIFVIGATNFPKRVDPALLRPGRMELRFEMRAPERNARQQLLGRVESHLEPDAMEALLDYSSGMSGAQIEAACREMVLAGERMNEQGARAALESVVFGESMLDLAEGVRETIAYHEAGHAVALIRGGVGRVDYVSLTAREGSAGHVWTSTTERLAPGLRSTRASLAAALAGRVAQRLRFGEAEGADAGDEQDLLRATTLAFKAVAHWGLDDEIGPLHLPSPESGIRLPALEQRVEERIQVWLRQAEQDAKTLLEANWPAVGAVAQALLDRGALAHERLYRILNSDESVSGTMQ